MFRYFVSYCYKINFLDDNYEFANAVIDLKRNIDSIKDISELEESLKNNILKDNKVKIDMLIIQNIVKL